MAKKSTYLGNTRTLIGRLGLSEAKEAELIAWVNKVQSEHAIVIAPLEPMSIMQVAGTLVRNKVADAECAVNAVNLGCVWINGVQIPSAETLEAAGEPKVPNHIGSMIFTTFMTQHPVGTQFAFFAPPGFEAHDKGERRTFRPAWRN